MRAGRDSGRLNVSRIYEGDAVIPLSVALPEITAQDLAQLRTWYWDPHLADAPTEARMQISVHSFVLRVDGRNILVDTCCGNDKRRSLPPVNMQHWPYLENLVRAACGPKTSTLVMCTHLHFDHVGWNTQLKDGNWVPTFPNARYLFGRRDLEFFSQQRHEALHREAFDDSVAPILDAGWPISSIPSRASIARSAMASGCRMSADIRLEICASSQSAAALARYSPAIVFIIRCNWFGRMRLSSRMRTPRRRVPPGDDCSSSTQTRMRCFSRRISLARRRGGSSAGTLERSVFVSCSSSSSLSWSLTKDPRMAFRPIFSTPRIGALALAALFFAVSFPLVQFLIMVVPGFLAVLLLYMPLVGAGVIVGYRAGRSPLMHGVLLGVTIGLLAILVTAVIYGFVGELGSILIVSGPAMMHMAGPGIVLCSLGALIGDYVRERRARA